LEIAAEDSVADQEKAESYLLMLLATLASTTLWWKLLLSNMIILSIYLSGNLNSTQI
jgi:hypothetical protein